jgi:phage terminase large subunit
MSLLTFDSHGNDKQKQVFTYWNDPAISDIAYGGSKGSGKSYLGCSLIFSDALTYDGTHYFIARKKLNDIRKFTIPSIHEVFQHWGLDERYYRYNGQDNFFELHNKSRVYLIEAKFLPSDPHFYRFGSMQMTRGWIEEAGEFEEAAKNNLAASIGRWKNIEYNLAPKLLQTCNPSKNYLYRDYYKKYKDNALPEWRKFVQALPTDNKKLPPGYLENLDRILNKNEKERLLRGNWEYDDDPSVLIEYDKIVDVFSNTHVEEGRKVITSDLARLGGDRIVIIEWSGFRGKVRAYQRQKLDVTQQRLEDARIRQKCGKSDILVDEDGLGGGIVDLYGCKGFVNNSSALPSPDAPPDHVDKNGNPIKENYDNIKSQCSFRMAERINKSGLFLEVEDDEMKDLIIEEMEQVKQKALDSDLKKGVLPKKKVKELLGRSPDFWDAVMMREWFELQPVDDFYIIDASGNVIK